VIHRSAIVVALLAAVWFVSVNAQESPPSPGPDRFSGELALEHIADQVALGPRPTGSAQIHLAGDLILDYLSQLGWQTSQDWHTVDFGPFLVPVRNLVASYGSGTTVIIGAHYDSRIYASRDPDTARLEQRVIGANDAGSGVGVLLELARVVHEYYVPNNEIRLLFFDAEDNGGIEPWIQWSQLSGIGTNGWLIGSSFYAAGLDLDLERIEYMILVDMVGDMDQRFPIEGYSAQFAPDLANTVWATAAELGYGEYFVQEIGGAITDDHVPFIQRGIPAVDIIDLDYPYWHTSEDTLDKISAESLERVGRVLQAFLEQTGVIERKD
jgi:Zn-dependent M28 family amino/carboxypeptidase